MKPKVSFNPLEYPEEFEGKALEDMSLDELEILLYSKRLKIQLELERLEKKINYSKFIYNLLKEFQIPEKLELLFQEILSGVKKPYE
ncbi:MAG: hypothetical protein N3A69_02640 [Leptospiraceae bacterium]|nr:hypothetical protein [Leptospiraceae bacterium]